jgi:alpha-galactosidase
VAGLFNTSAAPEVISTDASSLGLSGSAAYLVSDLWTHDAVETVGPVSAEVPAHGVALVRITPASGRQTAPPLTTVQSSGPATVQGADAATEKVTFVNDGPRPVGHLQLSLTAPPGLTVAPASPVTIGPVASGQTATTTFTVTVPQPVAPFTSETLQSSATYSASGTVQQASGSSTLTATGPPVGAPLATFSSASDAPAQFAQIDDQFGIEGAGADLFSGNDDYSAIYDKGAVSSSSTITTEVTSEQALAGFAKAGIIVRNDIAGSGTAPEGVILYDSPSGGVQLEYDDNGGQYIDAVTPPNGTILQGTPVYLRLTRSGDTYTGSYSTDADTWTPVGSATVPDQAATQDAGMFVVSHIVGQPGIATFRGFSVQ